MTFIFIHDMIHVSTSQKGFNAFRFPFSVHVLTVTKGFQCIVPVVFYINPYLGYMTYLRVSCEARAACENVN